MIKAINKYLFLVSALLCIFSASFIFAGEKPVAVLISQEIKPFMEMVEGFEQALGEPVVRIYLDKNKLPFSHDALYKGVDQAHYSCIVAVGPSALSWILNQKDSHQSNSKEYSKILYAMVLNPERIIPNGQKICGISLNLFSGVQVSNIPRVFPFIKKIGVLFDPKNNKSWFSTARFISFLGNIEIIPLHIEEQSDINRHYKNNFSNVDALLFIPDRTVISPTIIKHVIKQSIARNIPVIGYNSFFHRSGAAMSFILDFRGIGIQMADMVSNLLRGKQCKSSSPSYYIQLNRKVIDIMDIEVGKKLPEEVKEEK